MTTATAPTERTRSVDPAPRTGRGAARARTLALHIVLLAGGIAMVFPFLWMLLTSFKPLPQLLNDPLSFWPKPFTLQNYVDAWNDVPFGTAYWNTIYIAVLVGQCVVGVSVGRDRYVLEGR